MKATTLILTLVLAAFTVSAAAAKTTTIIELGQGGTLNWNGMPPPSLNCTKGGDDCKITITNTTNSIVSNGDYWHLDCDLNSGDATIFAAGQPPASYPISVNNFTFVTGFLVIEAGWFPGIPAMSVPMEGFSSDESGHMSFDVLKTDCIY